MVALTGIAAPIGLSFVLLGLLPLSPVQAFAAGAALCSTSLGTTFTVLATSGLTESRLGVVLSSAAMMDDVVGLIMVQIISSLGAGSTFSAVTVIRPVFVFIAFAVVIPLLARFVAKPTMIHVRGRLDQPTHAKYRSLLCCPKAAFVYQTAILLAMITGATYAGTSNLFAAYLAGASVTWLCGRLEARPAPRSVVDSTVSTSGPSATATGLQQPAKESDRSGSTATHAVTHTAESHTDERCSGKAIYESFYMPVVDYVLRPFFFASIGFAIPITRMFAGSVVWRGIVYTILMVFAKVICGAWLIRFAPIPWPKGVSNPLSSSKAPESKNPNDASSGSENEKTSPQESTLPAPKQSALPKPLSLYPGAILGMAMVSRGEIGFLISSVAESRGVFGDSGNPEFLVVTWAILLCTLIGPITVGLLVKRVKRLQQVERRKATGQEDPLGIWGVVPQSLPPG